MYNKYVYAIHIMYSICIIKHMYMFLQQKLIQHCKSTILQLKVFFKKKLTRL